MILLYTNAAIPSPFISRCTVLWFRANPRFAQFCRDTAVAITATVLVVDPRYHFFCACIFVRLPHALCMIVISCSGSSAISSNNSSLHFCLSFSITYVFALVSLVFQNQGLQVFRYAFSTRSRCTSASKSSSTFDVIFAGRPLLTRPRRLLPRTFYSTS